MTGKPKLFEVSFQQRRSVPPQLVNSLDRYFNEHVETGGFLRAVLENDLKSAVKSADPQSFLFLRELIDLLLESAPSVAWGNPQKVAVWLRAGLRDVESSGNSGALADEIVVPGVQCHGDRNEVRK